ncbi:MAG: hypothetical protein GX423_06605 [Nitrospiraceae bacterium]|jgi:hypothetical protein|nr:hypothetical protein [Nitrospiraceae bacterium]
MVDQKKLMNRVKLKTEKDRMTISSMMYFVGPATVFAAKDLVSLQESLQMAWLEGEALQQKELAPIPAGISIQKVLRKDDKDAMLFVLSDNTIVVVSASDPVSRPPQIIKPPVKN